MNIKLVYATKTGHSKKIANTIAKELKIESTSIKSTPKIENVDLLFIVGGIYGGQSLPEMVKFVQSLNSSNVKKAVLITSSMSKNTPQLQIKKILLENKIVVLDDEFLCQGSFLFFGLGHPNKTEISDAVKFVKNIIDSKSL